MLARAYSVKIRVIFGVRFQRRKVDKKQIYMKTETCKLYSRDFWIFPPNIIEIDHYNSEIYRFKFGAFFETQCIITGRLMIGLRIGPTGSSPLGNTHVTCGKDYCVSLYAATCSGVTVLAVMLRSKDQTYRETIALCLWRRLKVLSHRQHSSSTSAHRNSTGWTREHRRLVTSTLMDHNGPLGLSQSWVKCLRWQSTGWEHSKQHYFSRIHDNGYICDKISIPRWRKPYASQKRKNLLARCLSAVSRTVSVRHRSVCPSVNI